MTWISWRKKKKRASAQAASQPRRYRTARLWLERLEDRLAPATFSVDSDGVLRLFTSANAATMDVYKTGPSQIQVVLGAAGDVWQGTDNAPAGVTGNGLTTLTIDTSQYTGAIDYSGYSNDPALVPTTLTIHGTTTNGSYPTTRTDWGFDAAGFSAGNIVLTDGPVTFAGDATLICTGTLTVNSPLTDNGSLALEPQGDLTVNAPVTDNVQAADFARGDFLYLSGGNLLINAAIECNANVTMTSTGNITVNDPIQTQTITDSSQLVNYGGGASGVINLTAAGNVTLNSSLSTGDIGSAAQPIDVQQGDQISSGWIQVSAASVVGDSNGEISDGSVYIVGQGGFGEVGGITFYTTGDVQLAGAITNGNVMAYASGSSSPGAWSLGDIVFNTSGNISADGGTGPIQIHCGTALTNIGGTGGAQPVNEIADIQLGSTSNTGGTAPGNVFLAGIGGDVEADIVALQPHKQMDISATGNLYYLTLGADGTLETSGQVVDDTVTLASAETLYMNTDGDNYNPSNFGDGTVTLIGNEIEAARSYNNGPTISCTGALVVEPASADENIVIGSDQTTIPNALELSGDVDTSYTNLLPALAPGFSSLSIGRPGDGTGTVYLYGNPTFALPTAIYGGTFIAGQGVAQLTTTAGNDLTLGARTGSIGGVASTTSVYPNGSYIQNGEVPDLACSLPAGAHYSAKVDYYTEGIQGSMTVLVDGSAVQTYSLDGPNDGNGTVDVELDLPAGTYAPLPSLHQITVQFPDGEVVLDETVTTTMGSGGFDDPFFANAGGTLNLITDAGNGAGNIYVVSNHALTLGQNVTTTTGPGRHVIALETSIGDITVPNSYPSVLANDLYLNAAGSVNLPTGESLTAPVLSLIAGNAINFDLTQVYTTTVGDLTLQSGAGSMGTSAGPLQVDVAGDLSVVCTASVFVTSAPSLTLGNMGATNVDVTTTDSAMSLAGTVNVSQNAILNSVTSFTSDGSLNAAWVGVTATGSITGGGLNSFGDMSLDASGGAIGTSPTSPLSITVGGNLTAHAELNIYMQSQQNLTVQSLSSSAGQTVILTSIGLTTLFSAGLTNDTVTLDGGTGGLVMQLPTGSPLDIGNGAVTLIGDSMSLNGPAGSLKSTGPVLMQTKTNNQPITVGGSGGSGMDLTTSSINALAPGFSSITIGGLGFANPVTVGGDVTFTSPTTIIGSSFTDPAPAGTLGTSGTLPLTLHALTGAIGSPAAPVVVSAGGNLILTADAAGGLADIYATSAHALTLGQNVALTTGPGRDTVVLATTAGGITVPASFSDNDNLTLAPAGDLTVADGAIITEAALDLNAGGALLVGPTTLLVTTVGDLTLQCGTGSLGTIAAPVQVRVAGNLNLSATDSAFVTSAAALVLGSLNVTNNANITTTGGGMTVAGSGTIGGTATLTSAGSFLSNGSLMTGSLVVTAASSITGSGLLDPGDMTLNASTVINLPDVAVTGQLNATAQGNIFITSPNANLTVATVRSSRGHTVDITTAGGGVLTTLFSTGLSGDTVKLDGGMGGLVMQLPSGSPLDFGNGALTLIGDAIRLNGPAGSLKSKGPLVVQTQTTNQPITIGGSGLSGLNLTAASLNSLTGFKSISIGGKSFDNAVTIGGSVAFTSPTTIIGVSFADPVAPHTLAQGTLVTSGGTALTLQALYHPLQGSGAIGSAAVPVLVNVGGTLNLTTAGVGLGNIYVASTQPLSLGVNVVVTTHGRDSVFLSTTAGAGIVVNQPFSASESSDDWILQSSGAIAIGSAVGKLYAASLDLEAGGGALTVDAADLLQTSLGDLTLMSAGGSIGNSSQPVSVSVAAGYNLNIATSSPTLGSADEYVTSTDQVSIGSLYTGAAGSIVNIASTSAGGITLSTADSLNANVTITSAGPVDVGNKGIFQAASITIDTTGAGNSISGPGMLATSAGAMTLNSGAGIGTSTVPLSVNVGGDLNVQAAQSVYITSPGHDLIIAGLSVPSGEQSRSATTGDGNDTVAATTAGLYAGEAVSGPSIFPGTIITSVGTDTITLSDSATADGTFSLIFTANVSVSTTGGGILSTLSGSGLSVSGDSVTLDGGTGGVFMGVRGGVDMSDGSLTLIGDNISLIGPANSVTGSGDLILFPSTAGLPITLGGAGAGPGLNLTAASLSVFASGFNTLFIGNDGSNAVTTAGPVTFSSPTYITAASVSDSYGVVTTNSADLTLDTTTGNIDSTNLNVSGTLNLILEADSPSPPASINVQSAQPIVLGQNTIISTENGVAETIQLTSANITVPEDFGTQCDLILQSAGDITIGDGVDLSEDSMTLNAAGAIITGPTTKLETIGFGGNLTLISGTGALGTPSQPLDVNVFGTLTVTSGSTEPIDITSTGPLTLGNIQTGDKGDISFSSSGGLTLKAGNSLPGRAVLEAPTSQIDLGDGPAFQAAAFILLAGNGITGSRPLQATAATDPVVGISTVLTIICESGDIGSAATPLEVDSLAGGSAHVTCTSGNVYVKTSGTLPVAGLTSGSSASATLSGGSFVATNNTALAGDIDLVLGTTLDCASYNIDINQLSVNNATVVSSGGGSIVPTAGTLILGGNLSGVTGLVDIQGSTQIDGNNVNLAPDVQAGTLLIAPGASVGTVTISPGAGVEMSAPPTNAIPVGVVAIDTSGSVSLDPMIVNTTNLALNAGSTLQLLNNAGTTPGSGYDQIVVNGPVSIANASLDFTFASGFTPSAGTVFDVIQNNGGGAISGTFNGLPEGTVFTTGGVSLQISYVGGTSGHDVTLTVVGAPPTITSITPSLAGGTLAAGTTSLQVTFNEPVVGADHTANYQLQSAGPDDVLGTADDVTIPITSATVSGNTATLTFPALAEGLYRLTVDSTITDPTGIALDGTGAGKSGVNYVADFVSTAATTVSYSSPSFTFNPLQSSLGAGELVGSPSAGYDLLSQLQVAGADYVPTGAPTFTGNPQDLVTATETMAGLNVSREVTVPTGGSQDFARTVEILQNPTGSDITTTVTITSNLGTGPAANVFATATGDATPSVNDQWLGTQGPGGPAIIHYIHGPAGLTPTAVNVVADGIQWAYSVTVPAGQTVKLAEFNILNSTEAGAVAAPKALVNSTGFGGDAGDFLTATDLAALANFQFLAPPSANAGGPYTLQEGSTLTLDASQSSDANGFALNYSWTINGQANAASGVKPTLTYAQLQALGISLGGTYQIGLQVDDGHGGTATASTTLSVVVGDPAKLAFEATTNNAVAGKTIPAFNVDVLDSLGTLVSTDASSVTVAITTPNGATFSAGTLNVAASSGVASFSDLVIQQAGTYTLTATDGNLASAVSASFTISPDVAHQLAFEKTINDAVAGQTIPAFAVAVEDQYGNVVTTDTSTIAVAINTGPTSGSITTGTLSVAAVNGVASFGDLVIQAAGTYTLVATDASLQQAVSGSFTVSPDVASTLSFENTNNNAVSGQTIPAFKVDVLDQFGNLVTGDTSTVTVSLNSDPPDQQFASGTLSQPVVDGVATFGDLVIQGNGTYLLSANDGFLTPALSNAFTIALPLQVTANPVSQAVFVGQTATFTAASANPSDAVQWQVNQNDGNGFNDIPGATTTTLTIDNVTAAENGYQYQAVFSNAILAGSVASSAATLEVDVLTTSPPDPAVNVGQTATFTATSSNPSGTDAVQWQVNMNDGNGFSDIQDAANTTLTVSNVTAAEDGYLYQAVFSNPGYPGSLTTNPVRLSVDLVTANPTSASVTAFQTATFTAATANPSDAVQWQVNNNDGAGFENISGATETTLTISDITMPENGSQYQAVFTNAAGSMTTTAATLSVSKALPTVTASDSGGPYSGQAYPATGSATGVGGVTVRGSFTFTYTDGNGNTSAVAPSTAGTYAVVASFTSSDANYANVQSQANSFTITKLTPTLTATAQGGAFNGRAYAASASATGLGASSVSGTFSFSYKDSKGNSSAAAPMNAGTYTVTASFTSADPNYTGGQSQPAGFTITPATPILTLTDNSGPYTGQPFTAGATAAGVSSAAVQGSFTLAYTDNHGRSLGGAPSTPGTYRVVATFTSADLNYGNGVSQPASFSITPGPSGPITTDTPAFAWFPVVGRLTAASYYALRILNGRNVVWSVAKIAKTTYALPAAHALTPGHNYSWSLTGFTAAGKPFPSSVFDFQILPLGGPTAAGPTGNLTTDRPTFSWTPVADASHTAANHFTLTITDTTAKKTVTITNLSGTSYTLTAAQALTPGHNFTWTVTADSTNGAVTAKSQSASFTIAPLTAPTGLTFTSASDTFFWQAVTDAGHYSLIVMDTTQKQPQPTIISVPDVSGTMYQLTSKQAKLLKHGHTYTWYVTAVSTNGKVSVRTARAAFMF